MRTEPASLQVSNVAQVTAHAGQPPSFRSIFEMELSFVWNSLRRFGVAERDLEDVTHEVFVVVDRKFSEIDPTKPIRPWLFAIAFRTASDYRKRAYRRHESLADETTEHADPTERADDVLARHQEKNLAQKALLSVPEERRAVLVLHDFEEVSMHEIAAALEIPLKTAYSRLRIAREEFIAAARRLRKGES